MIEVIPKEETTCQDDTIRRQDAISVADSSDYVGLSVDDVKKVTDEVVKGLKQLPPAQLEQKVSARNGHWVKHDTGHSTYYDCSLCSCLAPCTEIADKYIWKLSNYCPDCGADMRGERNGQID